MRTKKCQICSYSENVVRLRWQNWNESVTVAAELRNKTSMMMTNSSECWGAPNWHYYRSQWYWAQQEFSPCPDWRWKWPVQARFVAGLCRFGAKFSCWELLSSPKNFLNNNIWGLHVQIFLGKCVPSPLNYVFTFSQIFSALIAGLVTLIIGFCFAELAAAIPSPGAASSYAHCYYGEFFAYFVGRCFIATKPIKVTRNLYFAIWMSDWTVFLTGWSIFLMNIGAAGAEARVWTDYATALLRMGNVTVPKYLYSINIPADGSLCSVSSVVYTLSQHDWSSCLCNVAGI